MKILVIGAGPLGSLLAARLFQGGHNVVLLARGKRIQELKKHGVVLSIGLLKKLKRSKFPLLPRSHQKTNMIW